MAEADILLSDLRKEYMSRCNCYIRRRTRIVLAISAILLTLMAVSLSLSLSLYLYLFPSSLSLFVCLFIYCLKSLNSSNILITVSLLTFRSVIKPANLGILIINIQYSLILILHIK